MATKAEDEHTGFNEGLEKPKYVYIDSVRKYMATYLNTLPLKHITNDHICININIVTKVPEGEGVF